MTDNIYVRKNDTTNIYSDQVHIFEVSVFDIDFIFFPLRIILDEAALHLSDKCNTVTVNLNRGNSEKAKSGIEECFFKAFNFGKMPVN